MFKLVTDEKIIEILDRLVLMKADEIYESCKLYHFYFRDKKISFSYNKSDLFKMNFVDKL